MSRGHTSWAKWPTQPQIPVEPTEIAIPSSVLEAMRDDIMGTGTKFQPTYENSQHSKDFGLTMDWMHNATKYWRAEFSWEEVEKDLNRHPHFTAKVGSDNNETFSLHFMALFSEKPSAIPIVFFHGWPGSFLEFMKLFDLIKHRYEPKSCPFHIIAPSLPGFTLSSGPPLNSDWDLTKTADLMDSLLRGLGFGHGYVTQGGDLGSLVCRALASSPACQAVHLNLLPAMKPDAIPDPSNDSSLTKQDHEILERSAQFAQNESAYTLEQGTKPATLGFVLANPISLLAWIGEKLHGWTDPSKRLTTKEIITHVSLYHLTQTISRSLWGHRIQMPTAYISKPLGYSRFFHDVSGVPKSWAATYDNLTFYRAHDSGGHFAALEKTEELWDDVEEFVTSTFPEGFSEKRS